MLCSFKILCILSEMIIEEIYLLFYTSHVLMWHRNLLVEQ